MELFLEKLLEYTVELAPALALGFLLSGIVHEFIPQSLVNKYLTQRGLKPILFTTFIGMLLPICCMGSLPVAVGLRKKGVPIGPVLAFLVATPATSLPAIIATLYFIGVFYTVFLCVTVILIGITLGIIGNAMHFKILDKQQKEVGECVESCCDDHDHAPKSRIKSALKFGFVDMVKDMWIEIIIGLVLAAAVISITPIGDAIGAYFAGWFGYVFAVAFGFVSYMCSTASVPLVASFLDQGMNSGAALVLLIIGPVTSYGTLLVVRKEFGGKVLLTYMSAIAILSVAFGYLYSVLDSVYTLW